VRCLRAQSEFRDLQVGTRQKENDIRDFNYVRSGRRGAISKRGKGVWEGRGGGGAAEPHSCRRCKLHRDTHVPPTPTPPPTKEKGKKEEKEKKEVAKIQEIQ
jgi:hypothetical protein